MSHFCVLGLLSVGTLCPPPNPNQSLTSKKIKHSVSYTKPLCKISCKPGTMLHCSCLKSEIHCFASSNIPFFSILEGLKLIHIPLCLCREALGATKIEYSNYNFIIAPNPDMLLPYAIITRIGDSTHTIIPYQASRPSWAYYPVDVSVF